MTIVHFHGYVDATVPLEANSGEVARRYEKLGGNIVLKVTTVRGHKLWDGFFRCQEIVDFVLSRAAPATASKQAPPADKR